jgi:hypothetical protein
MKYEFIKIKDNRTGIVYPNWFLLANTSKLIIEHTEKYFKTEIEKGVKDWFASKGASIDHLKTNWASAVYKMMSFKGSNFIVESTIMENEVFRGKINTLLKGFVLLLRENGTYTVTSDGDEIEILHQTFNEKMLYPNYTLDDIKINRFAGGKHYYPKIGEMEVEVDGVNKWNTPERAREMAEQYFKTL